MEKSNKKEQSPPPGRVVHCKRQSYDLYIGRPSPWGNPFLLSSEEQRDAVIAQYRDWLREKLATGQIDPQELLALRGKTLGCWCAPRPCHGDVLLAEAERLYQENSSRG